MNPNVVIRTLKEVGACIIDMQPPPGGAPRTAMLFPASKIGADLRQQLLEIPGRGFGDGGTKEGVVTAPWPTPTDKQYKATGLMLNSHMVGTFSTDYEVPIVRVSSQEQAVAELARRQLTDKQLAAPSRRLG